MFQYDAEDGGCGSFVGTLIMGISMCGVLLLPASATAPAPIPYSSPPPAPAFIVTSDKFAAPRLLIICTFPLSLFVTVKQVQVQGHFLTYGLEGNIHMGWFPQDGKFSCFVSL